MKRYNYSSFNVSKKPNNKKQKLSLDWWLIRYTIRQMDDEGNVSTRQVILPLREFMYMIARKHCPITTTILWFHKRIISLKVINPDGIECMLDLNDISAGTERNVLLIPVVCPRYGYKWNRKQILHCLTIAPGSTLRVLSPYLSLYNQGELRNIFKKHFKNILREINQYAKSSGETFYLENITHRKAKSKPEQVFNDVCVSLMRKSLQNKATQKFLYVDVVQ